RDLGHPLSGQVAGNLCGDDGASGLGVGRRRASRRFPLNAVHVDHENTGQTGHRGIDVPRHAEVADHQLLRLVTVGQAAVYIGERNHWPNRAGAAHDHVGVREHRSQVVERESIGGHPQLADLLSELLCAGQGPVHDVDALDPRAYQMLGRQRAHRARPDDDRAAAGQAAEPMPVSECTRLPTDSARCDSSCMVRPTVWLDSAAAYARRTWPSTCCSPMTAERCSTAASAYRTYAYFVRSPSDIPECSDSTEPITDRPPWNASTTA